MDNKLALSFILNKSTSIKGVSKAGLDETTV